MRVDSARSQNRRVRGKYAFSHAIHFQFTRDTLALRYRAAVSPILLFHRRAYALSTCKMITHRRLLHAAASLIGGDLARFSLLRRPGYTHRRYASGVWTSYNAAMIASVSG